MDFVLKLMYCMHLPSFRVIESFEEMLEKDIDVNKNIGKFGAQHILSHHNDKSVNVITHCNTGSLATAGYGTALGKCTFGMLSYLSTSSF